MTLYMTLPVPPCSCCADVSAMQQGEREERVYTGRARVPKYRVLRTYIYRVLAMYSLLYLDPAMYSLLYLDPAMRPLESWTRP